MRGSRREFYGKLVKAVELPVIREEPNTLLAIEVASVDITLPPVERLSALPTCECQFLADSLTEKRPHATDRLTT